MKTIVISGINLFEGGPLSIYYDCLDAIRESGIWKKDRIIAFVHKKSLFKKYEDIVKLIELPKSRQNYLFRIYYEYFYFYKISRKNHVDVWFSVHDITPRVEAEKLYTYCHSPAPFIKADVTKIRYSWRVFLASVLYRYFYRINIKSADAVIVQQEWMRQEFYKMFPVKSVIVARPNVVTDYKLNYHNNIVEETQSTEKIISGSVDIPLFFYASYPRYFKNFELILEACRKLERKGCFNFRVEITVDGTENRYSSDLKKTYGDLKTVKWLGILPREKVFEKYDESTCLIFPSTMETWGLPITEYKMTGKPILAIDLPYAHETVGDYEKVAFFENDVVTLEKIMYGVIKGKQVTKGNHATKVDEPYFESWKGLLDTIFEEHQS